MYNGKPYPHVIVIGAQKCGTTSLHMSLIKHSGIYGAVNPATKEPIKEMDFFFEDEHWSKGVDWYWSHFENDSGLTLDSSPNYLLNALCYQRIHEVIPHVKLILTLRNPVDRAYSQYNHYVQELPRSKTFDWDYTKDFAGNVNEQFRSKRTSASCFLGMVHKGIYIEQINLLLQYFDRSQLYITVMENWKDRYEAELENILQFLGLATEPLPDAIRHKRDYYVEPRNERTARKLAEFYKPYNELLFDFLGYDVPEWSVH